MKLFTRLCAAVALLVSSLSGQVVISQVYGGGGNSGATYTNDFVELFNQGTAAVNLSTWSVQYASSTGTSWSRTNLSGTIQPGGYFLVQQAQGSGGTTPLPTPDATGTIAMSATAGKVVLVKNQATITSGTSCPSGVDIADIVGFGTATNCSETAPTATLSNTTAALRASNGCTDTNNNSADFSTGAPNPRNSASPANPCTGAPTITVNPTSLPNGTVGVAYSQTFTASGGTSPYTYAVTAGSLPANLTLSTAGLLSGTPTTATVSNFTVTATDNSGYTGFRAYALTVSAPAGCTESHTISQIQGSGPLSPLPNGTVVTTRGIVTARRSNGFFLQMQTGDGNPATSDGIFVFTSSAPPSSATVGNDVCVSASVKEFIPSSDPNSPALTELEFATVTALATGLTLPPPATITMSDASPLGGLHNLEKYEGMRVYIPSLTVVAPTQGSITESSANASSNGVFFGVLSGEARPFREAGVQLPDPLPAGAPLNVPRFDANPERIRVDSDGQTGAPAFNVATGVTITGMTGVLDYGFRAYTVLPDASPAPTISTNPAPVAVPAKTASELTVASMNLQRFFDDLNDPATSDPVLTAAAYQKRLGKASLLIRNIARTPDIIGVMEMENITTLNALAARINADAVAAAQPNPGYTGYLVEGNDPGGIDVGFLVASHVTVLEATQFGKTATYTNPSTLAQDLLNDRPPLMLRARVKRNGGLTSMNVTIFANHLRSLGSIDDPVDGPRVRAKRAAQAEYLANLVQARQTADPAERIIVLGDLNAFSVNDGYVDVTGTIKGTPAPADTVVLASPDLVNPDLTNLEDTLTASERYSYTFDGNAQTLDHILVNPPAYSRLSRFAIGRVNADFPTVSYADGAIPDRLSDHDPAVAYFTLPADADATSQTAITGSGLIYSRITKAWTGSVTVKNTSASAISGPVYIVFENLPAGVTLAGAAGTTAAGHPYRVLNASDLAPGASVTLPVTFNAATPIAVSYTAKIVAGVI